VAVIAERHRARPSPAAPPEVLDRKPAVASDHLFKRIAVDTAAAQAEDNAIVSRQEMVAALSVACQQEQRAGRIRVQLLVGILEYDYYIRVSIADDVGSRAAEDSVAGRDISFEGVVLRRCWGLAQEQVD
jgi:hypothetical protein